MAEGAEAVDVAVDTQHEDMVHDAQLDYYSRKLATCSSDKTIKIFEVGAGDKVQLLATLNGHEGPIWQLDWAHPRYGTVLASASYDGTILIHREMSPGNWQAMHSYSNPDRQSFNSVSWAPYEYGLVLAGASSDGKIHILEHQPDDSWSVTTLDDSSLGCNAVSWAPNNALGSVTSEGQPVRMLVTGSCDNSVKLWKSVAGQKWQGPVALPEKHSDWVRDVAWAPCTGLPHNMIASGGEDGQVFVWTQEKEGGEWTPTLVNQFISQQNANVPVWRVSWSITGNVLAVSSADQQVTLWKQSLDGAWVRVSDLTGAKDGPMAS